LSCLPLVKLIKLTIINKKKIKKFANKANGWRLGLIQPYGMAVTLVRPTLSEYSEL